MQIYCNLSFKCKLRKYPWLTWVIFLLVIMSLRVFILLHSIMKKTIFLSLILVFILLQKYQIWWFLYFSRLLVGSFNCYLQTKQKEEIAPILLSSYYSFWHHSNVFFLVGLFCCCWSLQQLLGKCDHQTKTPNRECLNKALYIDQAV